MLLIGIRNNTAQTVVAGGLINLGTTKRRYCKKFDGIKTFDFNGTSLSLQQSGIYHITVTATFTAPAAGDVTIELYENGLPTGEFATETITTADTESRSVALDAYVLTDKTCVLGNLSTFIDSITLVNTSAIAVDIVKVTVNVDKVA